MTTPGTPEHALGNELGGRIFDQLCDPHHLGHIHTGGRRFESAEPPEGADPEVYPVFFKSGGELFEVEVDVHVRKVSR